MTQIGEFQTLFKEFKIIKIKNTLNSENTRLIKKMDNFEKFWILISPVFSSFFASSKFFLNLFAACLIFTEVLELVFYYFSYSWVQLGFEPTLEKQWFRRFEFDPDTWFGFSLPRDWDESYL